jgi:hypothetical protein
MGLLQLLLGPQVGGVTARLLAAVCSPKQTILSNSQCCGSGSGMNIPDHISESADNFFGLQILKFFDADPGSF